MNLLTYFSLFAAMYAPQKPHSPHTPTKVIHCSSTPGSLPKDINQLIHKKRTPSSPGEDAFNATIANTLQ